MVPSLGLVISRVSEPMKPDAATAARGIQTPWPFLPMRSPERSSRTMADTKGVGRVVAGCCGIFVVSTVSSRVNPWQVWVFTADAIRANHSCRERSVSAPPFAGIRCKRPFVAGRKRTPQAWHANPPPFHAREALAHSGQKHRTCVSALTLPGISSRKRADSPMATAVKCDRSSSDPRLTAFFPGEYKLDHQGRGIPLVIRAGARMAPGRVRG